jgi:hypothetical protein
MRAEKNFTQSCKKDLTIVALLLIMARGTLKKIVVELLLARRRQKSRRVKPSGVGGVFHVEHYAMPLSHLAEALRAMPAASSLSRLMGLAIMAARITLS